MDHVTVNLDAVISLLITLTSALTDKYSKFFTLENKKVR